MNGVRHTSFDEHEFYNSRALGRRTRREYTLTDIIQIHIELIDHISHLKMELHTHSSSVRPLATQSASPAIKRRLVENVRHQERSE